MRFSDDRDGDPGTYSRRRVLQLLQGAGVGGLVGAAGCSGDGDAGTDDETPTEPSTSPASTETSDGTITPTESGPASFTVTNLSPLEQSAPQGAPASVSVTVSNTGGSSGTRTVMLRMSGSDIDSEDISLDPGEETTVSLDFVTDTIVREYTFSVGTGDDEATGTLTITEEPNVVVLFAEDWNWGTVWDDPAVETPALDGLAENGVSFDRAFCSAPSCSPARSAIFSGQQFYRTSESSVLWGGYPEDLASYPGLLSEAGYTVGHTGKGYGPGPNEDAAGESYGSFEGFLEDRPDDEPFCFWQGTGVAHRDFLPAEVDPDDVEVPPYLPDEDAIREDIAAYYADVARIDEYAATIRDQLEQAGELENTIFIVTGDHGFAFPRGKANLYDSGTRVPLIVHWPAAVDGGQELTEFVNFPDVGPTLVEAGGAEVPDRMTGESFLDLLRTGSSSTPRKEAILGYERHVPDQEPPHCGMGYPMRAIRTDEYLYVHNFEPDRWPNGTPNYQEACTQGRWIASVDNGPTKYLMAANKDSDEPANDEGHTFSDLYDLAFGKRPQEELYVLENDPHQMDNVASEHPDVVEDLRGRLIDELEATDDPRVTQDDPPFDDYPYRGGGVTYPGDATIEQYELS
jgi:arylsulfatase A-like enzyme